MPLPFFWRRSSIPLKACGRDDISTPWALILVLLASTTINYLDRMTVSVLAPTLQEELGLTKSQYGWANNAFLICYLIMYSVGGRISDLLGVRRALALFVVWWSIACMLQAFVVGAISLALCRFLLAMGEGGTWPTVIKTVAERVPGTLRSFAVGVVNSGSSIGAMIAPPVVGFLALTWGWRTAFFVTGCIGLIWLPCWLWINPSLHPGVRARSGDPAPDSPESRSRSPISWCRLFRLRQAWAIFFGRLIGDGIWGFYIFWLPDYLHHERGLQLGAIALVAWIPFLAADAGNLVGGGLGSWLIARGWSIDRTRKTIMFTAAAGTMVGITAAFTSSLVWAIVAISFAGFCFICWAMNLLNLAADYFPPSYVGTVLGFSGTGSGLGTLMVNALTGPVVDRTGSYTLVLVIVGLLVPVAQVVLTLIGGKIERVNLELETSAEGNTPTSN